MKRIYVDMDDTLCDFMGAFNKAISETPKQGFPQAQVDFFRNLEPIELAISAMLRLNSDYDVWILTRPSINNPLCYMEKRLWVEDHLGFEWCERLILCPDKSLLIGDYLIDDQPWDFQGEQILFGSEEYPDWFTVLTKFIDTKTSSS